MWVREEVQIDFVRVQHACVMELHGHLSVLESETDVR